MKAGFAVIVEENFLKEIVQTENKYHEEWGFRDRLGMVLNLPHITLFQGDMDEGTEYEQIAEQIVVKIIDIMPQREIEFSQVVYVPEGWYFWECIKTPELAEIHDYTLSLTEPYIILDPKRLDRNLDALTEAQKEAIEHYGYRYAGEAFYPHITLGRSEGRNENVLEMARKEFQPRKTHIERVTVYKMGENGTHRDTLFEINF